MKELLLIVQGILILWFIFLVIKAKKVSKEANRILKESDKYVEESKKLLAKLKEEQ